VPGSVLDAACRDVASATLTGGVTCGLGNCGSTVEFPIPTASDRTYKLVQLETGACQDGLGGAGGLGGGPGASLDGSVLELLVYGFTSGTGQLEGNRFVVEEAPARVNFRPSQKDDWATPVEEEIPGNPVYTGYVALVDADSEAIVRVYPVRWSFGLLTL
jgi:hypothetical protein